jgi:hypothetical protein
MARPIEYLAPAVFGLFLAACAGADSVLFVTATSIGINGDTATQSVNIGYDRYEGVVAPIYDEGQAPPVYARLESDLSIVSPEISQVYATGDAALIAVRRILPPDDLDKLKTTAPKRIMVFGTGTHWGLEATFRTEALSSLSLGYKRAEASYIPLMPYSDRSKGDGYASVLAAINLDLEAEKIKDAGLKTSQFFATGDAARKLAARNDIHTAFKEKAEKGLTPIDPKKFPGIKTWNECQQNKKVSLQKLQEWLDSRDWSGKTKPQTLVFATNELYEDDRKDAVKHFCGSTP